MALTRKQIREIGVTDEEQITAILNAHKGEIEDVKDELKAQQKPTPAAPKPEPEPKAVQQPAEQTPTPNQASAPDEVEQLRRELAAERTKTAQREQRDAVMAALGAHKPRSADTIFKLLDSTKIVIKDGKVESGLDEQVKAIRAEQGYLFSDTPDTRGGAEAIGGAPGTPTMNDFFRGIGG